ncbi:glutamine--fructose-6-phosphate transaminase (isomerizing) [Alteromonas macleodii]|jgi:glucosamine--fructose-6-phosphate aminotransferase (isomerizing)|uniref:Glutamine--fructose-6-phosphate aminotransferase [isomerizing] n=1 Tax=Alteromonas macleodii (strain English Channel 673) TaxID=1004788 RepID=A0AB33A3X7_ALTME|nr:MULTISPECIES: glutamine--fructose-6-phosphate transaminase (isomerizing) [Alteromonas]MAN43123.1 glutamine--fructose-6-phosphate transaminase (isomerizing) [Alteromonas sp.]MEC7451086.1 glutamine--fructose-6-phosphate transaminase (isomerizing) [Pseudomonadota bacterium]NKX31462.1 glutamine--fructose-6-phosphate transaminase (isomerizing) [Alteromonadaceae bacterium A_SAG1]AFS39195.1 glucosamine-fructose-6-phosphate aminotransferase [Alteromonas macleodii ATCC 27126]AFT76379.1 glucosamine-f|tara:strand:- start:4259 stop:6091 length:1833 start_codon:yes stop_codon:yes gene_type:complete
MCGIVGAVAERNVVEILLEGLKRLEYRGYDSAGVALLQGDGTLTRIRRTGKVQELADAVAEGEALGTTGIAHTRWATHGGVTEANAHPHFSTERVAVVHNGIIENYVNLKAQLKEQGYTFTSDTDTETIAHTVHEELKSGKTLLDAVQSAVKTFHGAYGTVIMDKEDPSRVVVARSGSPLVIGLGLGENFIASDQMALLPVTRRFIFLEEGDVAEITRRDVKIFDKDGNAVEREVIESNIEHDAGDKAGYRHYMLKEIHEQPTVVRNALKDRIDENGLTADIFGKGADEIFKKVQHVQIIACGTSYHAGMTARYWLEQYANVSCNVEIASEFRYRKSVVHPNSLLITISQSGETADTLAALRLAKELGYMSSLTICNVQGSSLVRESDLAFMTRAGAEIGVASTKAFTTQLTAFLMLTLALGKENGMTDADSKAIVSALHSLPAKLEETLAITGGIEDLAEEFADKNHSLFLGRGDQYPIAMEGALKLKEISYIHAEAYASGELKHGPLALIDDEMPVIVVAPNNELLEKLKSNVEEVRARGGIMYVFADKDAAFEGDETMRVINVPHCDEPIAPIIYTLPLQLLSYYVALIKGTDVDQPRNLAKSVTVE